MVIYTNGETPENSMSREMEEDLLGVDNELVIPPFEGYDDDDEDDNDADFQIYEGDDETQIYKEDSDEDDETQIYEDDDENENVIDKERNQRALKYLYRYEQMVRQQEAEDQATANHLMPLFERLQVLGNSETNIVSTAEEKIAEQISSEAKAHGNKREIQLVEKIDKCELSNLISFEALKKAYYYLENTSEGKEEILATDQQLMFVLNELTSSYDDENTNDITDITNGDLIYRQAFRKRALTFPEFIHCYKTVVNGMMALQMFPNVENIETKYGSDVISMVTERLLNSIELTKSLQHQKNELSKGILYHRSKTKERSVSMLRTFCLESETKEENPIIPPQSSPPASPVPLPVPSSTPKKESKSDELLVEMRKIIALKDRQIEDLTKQMHTSDDQSVVSSRSQRSIRPMSRSISNNTGLATQSSSKWKKTQIVAYFQDLDDLPKRRLTFGIIVSLAFVIWYVSACLVVQTIKPPTNGGIDTQKLGAVVSFTTQDINENYISKEIHTDLRDTFQTSLQTISQLEKQQNMNLKQISKLESTLEKMGSDCLSTTTKIESQVNSCEYQLESILSKAIQNDEHIQNITHQLDMCETQVSLLEPNTQLSEEERRLIFQGHNQMTRQRKRRKQIVTVLAGAAGAILAPHFFAFLGNVGSSMKIISLKGVSGTQYVWNIPWLSVLKFPFMKGFFGSLGGAMSALRDRKSVV